MPAETTIAPSEAAAIARAANLRLQLVGFAPAEIPVATRAIAQFRDLLRAEARRLAGDA